VIWDETIDFLALKMLVGDRTKYAGLLFGVTFTSFSRSPSRPRISGGMMTAQLRFGG